MREKIKKILGGYLDEKYVVKWEKLIYQTSVRYSKIFGDNITQMYKLISYEIVARLSQKETRAKILSDLSTHKLLFASPFFLKVSQEKRDNQEMLIDPPKIEKGAAKCKCGSEEVYYYTAQNRSCDEASTTHYTCMGYLKDGSKCPRKWSD